MRFNTILSFFLLTVACMIGCKKDDNPTSTGSNTGNFLPLPLKVGNQWVYNKTTSDGTYLDTLRVV